MNTKVRKVVVLSYIKIEFDSVQTYRTIYNTFYTILNVFVSTLTIDGKFDLNKDFIKNYNLVIIVV